MSEEVDSLVCEQLSPVPAALLPLSQPHRLGVGSFPRMLFSVFSQQANGASVMAADRAGSIRRVELPSDVVSDLERGQLDEEELSDERIAMEPPAPPSIRVTDGLQPGVPLASYRERDGQLSCSLPDFVSLRKEMLMQLILHKDVSLTDVHDYCQRYEELHLESESEAPSNLQVTAGLACEEDVLLEETSIETSRFLLQACSQCQHGDRCTNDECSKGRILYQYINEVLRQGKVNDSEKAVELIRSIHAHYEEDCSEPLCSMPFCSFFAVHLSRESSVCSEDIAQWLQDELERCRKCIPGITKSPSQADEFFRFDRPQSGSRRPLEGPDYTVRNLEGAFYNRGLALATRLPPQFCYLRKIPDFNSNTWHRETVTVLRAISERPSSCHVVSHLWLLFQPEYYVICSRWELSIDVDLNSSLRKQRPSSEKIVQEWLPKLRDVQQFLMSCEVLYMNWLATSIACSRDYSDFKLADFSCAISLHSLNVEDEDVMNELKLRVPPYIAPPEVLRGLGLTPSTDLWGIGALLFEMTTGEVIHASLCHQSVEEIRQEIGRNPVPDVTLIEDQVLKSVMQSCLQVDPASRSLDFQQEL